MNDNSTPAEAHSLQSIPKTTSHKSRTELNRPSNDFFKEQVSKKIEEQNYDKPDIYIENNPGSVSDSNSGMEISLHSHSMNSALGNYPIKEFSNENSRHTSTITKGESIGQGGKIDNQSHGKGIAIHDGNKEMIPQQKEGIIIHQDELNMVNEGTCRKKDDYPKISIDHSIIADSIRNDEDIKLEHDNANDVVYDNENNKEKECGTKINEIAAKKNLLSAEQNRFSSEEEMNTIMKDITITVERNQVEAKEDKFHTKGSVSSDDVSGFSSRGKGVIGKKRTHENVLGEMVRDGEERELLEVMKGEDSDISSSRPVSCITADIDTAISPGHTPGKFKARLTDDEVLMLSAEKRNGSIERNNLPHTFSSGNNTYNDETATNVLAIDESPLILPSSAMNMVPIQKTKDNELLPMNGIKVFETNNSNLVSSLSKSGFPTESLDDNMCEIGSELDSARIVEVQYVTNRVEKIRIEQSPPPITVETSNSPVSKVSAFRARLNAKRVKTDKSANSDLFIPIKPEECSKDDLLSMLTGTASMPSSIPDHLSILSKHSEVVVKPLESSHFLDDYKSDIFEYNEKSLRNEISPRIFATDSEGITIFHQTDEHRSSLATLIPPPAPYNTLSSSPIPPVTLITPKEELVALIPPPVPPLTLIPPPRIKIATLSILSGVDNIEEDRISPTISKSMMHHGFNLLKTPSRPISTSGDEGHKPGTPTAPRYDKDDYANYGGRSIDSEGSPYFADDNPLRCISAKIQESERLGAHRYEFSGQLGAKIKLSAEIENSPTSKLHMDQIKSSSGHDSAANVTNANSDINKDYSTSLQSIPTQSNDQPTDPIDNALIATSRDSISNSIPPTSPRMRSAFPPPHTAQPI